MEGSGLRWRGAIADGGERSQVEGSGLRWRGEIADGGERSQVATAPPVGQAAYIYIYIYIYIIEKQLYL